MREHLETQYGVQFSLFAEWDGESEQYAVWFHGEYILADSLALLLAELQSRTQCALRLAA